MAEKKDKVEVKSVDKNEFKPESGNIKLAKGESPWNDRSETVPGVRVGKKAKFGR